MYSRKPLSGSVPEFPGTNGQTSLQEPLAPEGEQFEPVPCSTQISVEDTAARWRMIPHSEYQHKILMSGRTVERISCFQSNIENFLGTVEVPVGLAGPLRVHGLFAQGDYFIPLATTEAALVASYHRGAQLITEAGSCNVMLLDEGVGRAPGFGFRSR